MPKKNSPMQGSTEDSIPVRQEVRNAQKSARAIPRARIVLLADEHQADDESAETLGVGMVTGYRVRENSSKGRRARARQEKPRRGAPTKIDGRVAATLPMLALADFPEGEARWLLQ